jgi:hypothetical protein
MLALEGENVALMRGQRDIHTMPVADAAEVQRWALARGLSLEQTNAAVMTLSSNQGILAIEGLAGAAKTTTVVLLR